MGRFQQLPAFRVLLCGIDRYSDHRVWREAPVPDDARPGLQRCGSHAGCTSVFAELPAPEHLGSLDSADPDLVDGRPVQALLLHGKPQSHRTAGMRIILNTH